MNTIRRMLIQAAAACAVAPTAFAQARRFEPAPGPWRTFEVTLRAEIADVQGTCKVWLPVPDIATDFQRTLGHDWSGNAQTMKLVADPARDVRMLYAEFAPGTPNPGVQVTSRVQTKSRAVDWRQTQPAREDAALLRDCLAATELIPTDGLVRQTALAATKGAHGDAEQARALFDWVVANAHREPKVRGCGVGDVKAMLESGDLGGKCADLNAIFVGLCRAVGIPARDLYGVRVAPSAFGYRELGANPANLKSAQHCRAEVFLRRHGWVAMDPADVLKVMRQETPEWIKDPAHPLAAPVNQALFGGWEGNWIAYNTGHDVRLPGSTMKGTLPFLMYPQGENASGRFDELAPDNFRYTITSRELTAA
jgi:transglutaminase-like putative cysteine protease